MRSLRSRLTLTYILVALVAVAVVAVLASFLIQRGFDSLADRQATADAEDIADRLQDYYEQRGSWQGVEMLMRRRFPLHPPGSPAQRRRMQVVDAEGAVIFDSARPGAARELRPIRNAVSVPIEAGGEEVGQVLASSDRDDLTAAEREFLARVRLSVLIGSAAAGVVALVTGLVIASGVTSPLRSLTAAARRLASGGRHDPLLIPADRELAELAIAFNSMAAELERAEELRRQQVADIAHELRTPLSVLRLQLESIEDGIEQPTPQLLGSLTEEVGLLSRLVDDLRLVSLADAGQLTMQIEAVDVAEALQQIGVSAAPRARQQQIELLISPTAPGLAVSADRQRLSQVMGNLVENALRYTPPGGTVTIQARATTTDSALTMAAQQQGARAHRPVLPRLLPDRHPTSSLAHQDTQPAVLLSVSDTGAGIPPAELERIFDRFWRADRARARETGGTGLGLVIVRQLVQLQGGRIWAESAPGQGATFFVELPAVAGSQ